MSPSLFVYYIKGQNHCRLGIAVFHFIHSDASLVVYYMEYFCVFCCIVFMRGYWYPDTM